MSETQEPTQARQAQNHPSLERLNDLDWVGPVLLPSPTADAMIAVIKQLNQHTKVTDRGSYVRITAPKRCILSIPILEQILGHSFVIPQDLEVVMPSFSGTLKLSPQNIVWSSPDVSPDNIQ